MNWIPISDISLLNEIDLKSHETPIVIFKHSTRCSVSSMSQSRLERGQAPANIPFYHLDLIAHRDISNEISSKYHVHHESPQLLLIKDGACIYEQSHNGITMEDLIEQL